MNLPDNETASLTPMMKQYFELKEKAPDAVLLFRMGDFYEIFGEDAKEVAPKLELVMTSRERVKGQERIPFCGVPHHIARNYWLKLLKMGYKVAIADQIEDPKLAKGIVKRDIVRVLTPGCIDELEGLESDEPNYLMGIYQDPEKKLWSIVVADISTGEMRCGNCADLPAVVGMIEKFKPTEIVTRKFLRGEIETALAEWLPHQKVIVGDLSEAILRDESRRQQLYKEVFGNVDLDQQRCGNLVGGYEVIAAVLEYLVELKASYTQFLSIKPLVDPDSMILDEIAVRDLELFETVRRRSKDGSLFFEINRTMTPMGARLLRESLVFPLLDKNRISARHDAVDKLLALDPGMLSDLRQKLKGIADLERLTIRILSGRVVPTELIKVKNALEKAVELRSLLLDAACTSHHLFEMACHAFTMGEKPYALLESALSGSMSPQGSLLDIFKEGYDTALDTKRELARDGQSQIDKYESLLKQQTVIGSLKIRQHKTFGLLIEVTKSNLTKVPANFIRRQTMVNCERFVTVELQELSDALMSAHEDAIARETELLGNLISQLSHYVVPLKAIAQAVAELDLIQSFAYKARESSYIRPRQAQPDEGLTLVASRHPVVERYVGKNDFVPNDLLIAPEKKYVLITGPNMAGKSTIMRQIAICAILHQIGSFIPANSAVMPVFDRIFTRVGAADDLAKGQSTFMVEMSEAAHILREASERSLVILDEVGRGTSTQDGLALASAILEDLVETVKCYTLFATHYHELVPLAERFKNISMLQTEVLEKSGRIHFTHRIIEGASGSSFGIEVARIAGVPQRVIEKAGCYLADKRGLANEITSSCGAKEACIKKPFSPSPHSPGLFSGSLKEPSDGTAELKKIAARLEMIKIHRTTPLQALNILNDLKGMLSGGHEVDMFQGQDALL